MEATIAAMEEILGLGDLRENMDLNLVETGLLDSLAIVTLISRIEELTGRDIRIRDMDTSDFTSVRSIVEAIAAQVSSE